MNNVPVIKIGIVAVSRDCFPESLAVNRRKAVIAEYEKKFGRKENDAVSNVAAKAAKLRCTSAMSSLRNQK